MYLISKEELENRIKTETNYATRRVLEIHLQRMVGTPDVCVPCGQKAVEEVVEEVEVEEDGE